MSDVTISRDLLAYMMGKLQMVGQDAGYLRAAQDAYYCPAPVQVPDGYRLQPHSEFDAMNAFIRGETKVPPGYALVPVEPTPEMLEAIANTVPCMTSDARLAYPAMLAAAPAATVQVPDEPTEAMLAAFCDVAITPGAWVNSTDADRKQVRDELTKCYHAMLAAAPSPATVATEAVAQEADTATLAYDAGFRRACDWARRDDLLHELESFAYKQDRAFDIERLGLADAHALLDAAVAQGGGVDVEKVMGLVEEYGDLMCSVGMNSGQPWARKHTAECRKEADTSLAQIRALLSAPPAASGWIPVGERRPGVGVVVLGFWKNSAGPHSHVTGQNYGITARNEHGLWYDASEDDNEDDEWMRPDYWQPLPPPPAIANQEAQDGR